MLKDWLTGDPNRDPITNMLLFLAAVIIIVVFLTGLLTILFSAFFIAGIGTVIVILVWIFSGHNWLITALAVMVVSVLIALFLRRRR